MSPGHKYNRAAWAAARRRERALADKAALLERVRRVCNTPEMDALVRALGDPPAWDALVRGAGVTTVLFPKPAPGDA